MKLSLNMLKQYTEIAIDPAEYERRMIMSGTAVEGVEELGAELSGVVVGRVLTVAPVEVVLSGVRFTLESVYRFIEGGARIEIERRVLETSDPAAALTLDEYATCCYGTTEYPEDMNGITLRVSGAGKSACIEYAYRCREEALPHAEAAEAVIPQICTRLTLSAEGGAEGYIREGYAFSPMFTLGMKQTITGKGTMRSWLSLAKEN